MLKELKEAVWEANMQLTTYHLVLFTWGNVSGIDRDRNVLVIKPSGVPYGDLGPGDMVVVDLATGNVVEGHYKPSSDTPTHIELYKGLADIGGIVHTHSSWATIWAQRGEGIPALGTTHADYFYGEVPCTRKMTAEEISGAYEKATGTVILESLAGDNKQSSPAILVHSHGPFTWGKSPGEAVYHAAVLEEVSRLANFTLLGASVPPMQQELLDKHFFRKHGCRAYYGQEGG